MDATTTRKCRECQELKPDVINALLGLGFRGFKWPMIRH